MITKEEAEKRGLRGTKYWGDLTSDIDDLLCMIAAGAKNQFNNRLTVRPEYVILVAEEYKDEWNVINLGSGPGEANSMMFTPRTPLSTVTIVEGSAWAKLETRRRSVHPGWDYSGNFLCYLCNQEIEKQSLGEYPLAEAAEHLKVTHEVRPLWWPSRPGGL